MATKATKPVVSKTPVHDRVIATSLVIIAVVMFASALQYTKNFMIPFVLSLFIAFIVSPLIVFFKQRCKLPRSAAVLTTIALVVGSVVLLSVFVVSNVRFLVGNIEEYQSQFYAAAEYVIERISELKFVDIKKESLIESIEKLPVFDYIGATAGKLLGVAMDAMLVMIFVLFILTGKPQKLPSTGIWGQVARNTRVYLITKTMTSTFTGVFTTIILMILGLDMAMMFGLLAFLLNFIPTIGSLVAILLPLPIALLQYDSALMVILAIALPGCVQLVSGNVIEPKYMGDVLDLHPVTILLALMFWGLLWGIPGMILATPICVIIKLFLSQFEGSRVFSELMSGRLPIFSVKTKD